MPPWRPTSTIWCSMADRSRWRRRRAAEEERHYDALRRPSEGQDVFAGHLAGPDGWLDGSVGSWLPADERAAYVAKLRGEPVEAAPLPPPSPTSPPPTPGTAWAAYWATHGPRNERMS